MAAGRTALRALALALALAPPLRGWAEEVVPEDQLIFGVGLPRTGTQTLTLALSTLGYKVSHGGTCNPPSDCLAAFCNWWKGGSFEPVAQNLISQGSHAFTDEPYCIAFRELAERFPKAKFILTLRDSPEQWFRSFAEMQDLIFFSDPAIHSLMEMGHWTQCDMFPHLWFDCDIFSSNVPESLKRECMHGYLRHMYAVQRAIPPERLLVYNVREGWPPLARFLNKSVPEAPLPRLDIYVGGMRDDRGVHGHLVRSWRFFAYTLSHAGSSRDQVIRSTALGVAAGLGFMARRQRPKDL